VFRALIGYGIAAFAVLQIIEPVMHGLHWPETVLSYVVAALAAGFPVVITLAWIFDVKGGRIERTAPAATSGGQSGARLALVLIGISVLAAAPGIVWYFAGPGTSKQPPRAPSATDQAMPSIAVLPFADMSPAKDQEYFSDGIAEEILNGLAQIEGLRVIGRTSSFSFKGKNEDLRSIGDKLRVSTILEGSVRKAGNRLRITAQLTEASGGSHLWSQTYERELTDLFAVQDEIAKAVVTAMKVKLVPRPGPAPSIIKRSTPNVEAYNLYLKGRYFWSFRPDRKPEARKYFEQALQLDPEFAAAHAGLADWYATFGSWEDGRMAPSEAMPRAKEEAERALQIDRALAAPHATLAYVKLHYDRDYVGSEREFKEALRLDPGSLNAHHWYSHLLTALSRREESLRESKVFLELDVLGFLPPVHLCWHYFMAHQYRESIQALEKSIELDPHWVWIPAFQGFAHERLGQAQLAIEDFKTANKAVSGLTFVTAGLGYTYATHGQRDEAQKLLDELKTLAKQKYVPSYDIALIYVGLGDNDQAFQWLQKAEEEHSGWMVYFKVEPRLESLRKDPRYSTMLRRLGLDQ